MNIERFTPTMVRVGASSTTFRRSRSIIPLAVVLLGIFAASAQAHIVTATATCGSVTFNWSYFSGYGNGNGGLNTPDWEVVFKPAAGSIAREHGVASFAGSSFSLKVAIPSGNGVVTASSAWSSAQTRDGNSNSKTENFTIANCPVAPIEPPPPVEQPPPTTQLPAATPLSPVRKPAVTRPASPVSHTSSVTPTPGTVALSTRASTGAALGGAIRDVAALSGGSSPTGTINFSLYSPDDPTCSKALRNVTVLVSGDGSYLSPPVTPASSGSYQWVATYSGDEHNKSVSAACDDPVERSSVSQPVCVRSQVAVRGVTETVRNSVSAYAPARGVKRVTFYLDRRKLVTLTKPSRQRFSVTIDARKLSFGVHRLTAKVTMLSSSCTRGALEATFIHVKPISLSPQFAG